MSVFHVKYPTPKHVENSIRGVRLAKKAGDDEIDIDLSWTAPDPKCPLHPAGDKCRGHVMGNHWPFLMIRDGFKDPLRRISRNTPFRQLTYRQVRRLYARTGARVYRVQRIERLLLECARVGIGAVLEPKGDPRFEQDWIWEYLAKECDRLGAHARVYALPASSRALAPAKRAGFKAHVIGGH